MPLYETAMQEKPPVVFDIGKAYTKLGFAGESHPRKIIPSRTILSVNGKEKGLFDYDDTTQLFDQMVEFLQMVFFKYLLISPKERKIVLLENVFGETVMRDTLTRVLFRHFEVSSIMYVPSHMIALSTLAIDTACVIDMGYTEVTVVPVYCGVQILKAFQDHSYGSQKIHKEIKEQLISSGVKKELLTEMILEDIKVRACFVTTMDRAQSYKLGTSIQQAPNIEYPIHDKEIIVIPGRCRELVYEIMFEESNERDSLPHLILQSLAKCSRDIRKNLLENILVIGGSAIVMGLLSRLKAELNHLLTTDEEYKKIFFGENKVKFHKTIGRPNVTSWMGGSLCGATDLIQTKSLNKESYLANEHVPDWTCLSDNKLVSS